MKKTWLLSATLVGGLALTAPAHAFLLDGFGNGQGPVEDSTDNGTAVTDTKTSGVTDTDFDNPNRTLTVDKTDCGPGCEPTESAISAHIFTDGVGNTVYSHSQDDGVGGFTEILWDSFDSAASFTDPVTIGVNILSNDVGGTITLTLSDGTDSSTDSFSFGGGVTGFHGVTLNAGATDFDMITSAALRIDGNDFLDMAITSVETPEPGVLGLLGVGLIGMAFVARRQRRIRLEA